jgi:tetratricopeptide (TPR) repeat protein
VGIPVLLLLLAEGALRLAGYGRASTFLIPDSQQGYFRTNPEFASLFLPGNFDLRPLNFRVSRHKAPNTVRIVVLGESAAQGIPVPSFAFAAQLRAQLRARFPGKEIEVLNTGIVAVNSHVVYQVARELSGFEPDLFVVYAGNNEVVGPYGPGCAYLSQMPPLWVIRASVFVRSTRTGQLIAALVGRLSGHGRHEVEWGGMSMFVDQAVRGGDPRLEAVYSNFASNLRDMIAAASRVGARTILCTVVANLKDCPPFLSRHADGLSPSRLTEWQGAFDEARLAWRLGDNDRARIALAAALRVDPEYADSHFLLGSVDLRSGDVDLARREFLSALHWDALRFRPDVRINQVIREAARAGGGAVTLLDAAAALGADPASAAPLSGRELLFEHVHFDWEGNYRLARMMAESCAAALGGSAKGPWLDSDACAAALAYTAHERLPMLLRIDVLVRKPPFTNQITYVEDQARMAREIAAATLEARKPETISRASEVATAALAHDPGNPALAGILEGIDLDLGDLPGALALARRAEGLLPRDFALSADEASILMRMGRLDEAGRILTDAGARGADVDLLAPVLLAYWTRTRRFDEGKLFLGRAMAGRPADGRLPLLRGQLLEAAGDSAGAEGDYRAVLARDPGSQDALESLIALIGGEGRQPEVDKLSLAAAERQPGNETNDLRAAKIAEAANDENRAVQFLEAAEHSGPVNATIELTIALKLYQLRRLPETLSHLAEARQLSVVEGDPAVTLAIDRLIDRVRTERRPPGG